MMKYLALLLCLGTIAVLEGRLITIGICPIGIPTIWDVVRIPTVCELWGGRCYNPTCKFCVDGVGAGGFCRGGRFCCFPRVRTTCERFGGTCEAIGSKPSCRSIRATCHDDTLECCADNLCEEKFGGECLNRPEYDEDECDVEWQQFDDRSKELCGGPGWVQCCTKRKSRNP